MKLKNPLRDIRTISTLLTGAEAEAQAAGEAMPGAEHLLLSALFLPDGSARRAFERIGAGPSGLRSAIADQHADALRGIGIEPVGDDALGLPAAEAEASPGGVFRATASGQAAFRAAVALSKERRGVNLVGAHVVAAVARMENGTAARALRAMGIDRDALSGAAHQEVDALEGRQ